VLAGKILANIFTGSKKMLRNLFNYGPDTGWVLRKTQFHFCLRSGEFSSVGRQILGKQFTGLKDAKIQFNYEYNLKLHCI
jgi:hypothetical protein